MSNDAESYLSKWCINNCLYAKYDYFKSGFGFLSEIRIDGYDYIGTGKSSNKRNAAICAAMDFIKFLVNRGDVNESELIMIKDAPSSSSSSVSSAQSTCDEPSAPSAPLSPLSVESVTNESIIIQETDDENDVTISKANDYDVTITFDDSINVISPINSPKKCTTESVPNYLDISVHSDNDVLELNDHNSNIKKSYESLCENVRENDMSFKFLDNFDGDDSLLEKPLFLRIGSKCKTLKSHDSELIVCDKNDNANSLDSLEIPDNEMASHDDDDVMLNESRSYCGSPIKAYDFSSPIRASSSPIRSNVNRNVKRRLIPTVMDVKKREREMKRHERERIRFMKELNKQRDHMNKEVLKSKSLKMALKYVYAVIDNGIFDIAKNELNDMFVQNGANIRENNNHIPMSVVWKRKELNLTEEELESGICSQATIVGEESDEQYLLIVIPFDDFVNKVNAHKTHSGDTLYDYVKKIKHEINHRNLILVIYRLDSYFKREKNKSNNMFKERFNNLGHEITQNSKRQNRTLIPSINKDDADLALIDMEIKLNQLDCNYKVSVTYANDAIELSTRIFRYTRSIAESQCRHEKNLQQNFAWYAEGDNKNTVDPKDSQDFKRLWKRQIMQFPKISSDIANTIVEAYPSPKSLLNAYYKSHHPEMLLSELTITRKQITGAITQRRVGPEISKRIHLFMTCRIGTQLLNHT